jgi:hypothetical protein
MLQSTEGQHAERRCCWRASRHAPRRVTACTCMVACSVRAPHRMRMHGRVQRESAAPHIVYDLARQLLEDFCSESRGLRAELVERHKLHNVPLCPPRAAAKRRVVAVQRIHGAKVCVADADDDHRYGRGTRLNHRSTHACWRSARQQRKVSAAALALITALQSLARPVPRGHDFLWQLCAWRALRSRPRALAGCNA